MLGTRLVAIVTYHSNWNGWELLQLAFSQAFQLEGNGGGQVNSVKSRSFRTRRGEIDPGESENGVKTVCHENNENLEFGQNSLISGATPFWVGPDSKLSDPTHPAIKGGESNPSDAIRSTAD